VCVCGGGFFFGGGGGEVINGQLHTGTDIATVHTYTFALGSSDSLLPLLTAVDLTGISVALLTWSAPPTEMSFVPVCREPC